MGIIVKTTAEFETQKEMLLRSITRAEKLITPMEIIGERETDIIQELLHIIFHVVRYCFVKDNVLEIF